MRLAHNLAALLQLLYHRGVSAGGRIRFPDIIPKRHSAEELLFEMKY